MENSKDIGRHAPGVYPGVKGDIGLAQLIESSLGAIADPSGAHGGASTLRDHVIVASDRPIIGPSKRAFFPPCPVARWGAVRPPVPDRVFALQTSLLFVVVAVVVVVVMCAVDEAAYYSRWEPPDSSRGHSVEGSGQL